MLLLAWRVYRDRTGPAAAGVGAKTVRLLAALCVRAVRRAARRQSCWRGSDWRYER